jgi:hypothetical protein
VPIGDETPWVQAYRGLWGLDTEDPLGGERAPAGPRYERDGSVRRAWANPLGWAGLLGVPPEESAVPTLLTERIGALERRLRELDATIADELTALRGLRVQARSLSGHDAAPAPAQRGAEGADEREAALDELISTRTRLDEERRAHLATLAGPIAPEPPHAHLRMRHGPRVDEQERRRRFLRVWSVLSAPLLLVAIIVVLNAQPLTLVTTLVVLAAVFAGMEAFARRRFASFLASAAVLAVAVAATAGFLLLFREHWRIAVSVVVGIAALALLIGNLGDLRHRWRRM